MIQMKKALDTVLNKQYAHPQGVMGWIAGEVMVRQHRLETAWSVGMLDIQPGDKVLEVGFGAGRGIELAVEKAKEGRVVGVDLSEEMVRVASRRNMRAVKEGHAVLLQGDITALPFEDQSFDRVLTIHTFYFWPEPHEPSQALSELCRVLKPGGWLVITLTTGTINAQGEVEVWEPLQSAVENKTMPGMRRAGLQNVRLERGPDSRNFVSVAIVGERGAS